MPISRAFDRHRSTRRPPAKSAAACSIALALTGTGLAAGLHHATTDSAASWPAPGIAAVLLAACAYPAIRSGAPRAGTLALTTAQALLPSWLALTRTDVPAARLDGRLRLPAARHHQPLAMAALNLLAGLALILLLRSTADLPARLTYAAAGTAHRWWTNLPYVIRLLLRRTDEPLPRPRRAPRPAVALRRPHALVVLLHRAQPCAP
ncbi:hypothetical protein [Streptomyces sp. TLI_105]|uniref:hypothetical protein n=1 Tax=Streptomyces sp. TLI_105 TaxID=1881019 RepID=UPI00115F8231|nr:hypothetical protein [Streptomyces sp. TLI_105]